MHQNNEIIIYQSDDGNISVNVMLQDENVWLTQSQLAQLFGKDRSVIAKHIKNILSQEELESSVCANFAHTASDGKVYDTQYYNLDMIISIGYRVNSKRGIQFRRWSSNILKKYLIKLHEASALFGIERSEGLKSILGNLEQGFSGEYLYPSVEEKAAHLLYFAIKNHPFIDGNKRIGCLLFLLFLQRSSI